MTAVSPSFGPPPSPAYAAGGWAGERGWHVGWALAQAALIGAVLVALGEGGGRLVLALAAAAAPGLLGAAWPRGREQEPVRLAAWTVGAGLAAAFAGGVAGPLAPYLLMPALAALAQGLGLGWAVGVTAAAAAGAGLAGGATGVPPTATTALGWACATLTAAAAGWAWTLARPSAVVVSHAPPPPAPSASVEAMRRERDAALAERDAARETAAARTRFLAQMSHELRTPLNAIIGFSDIMRTRLFGPMPERYGEYAGLIHESGEHLLSMINDVLDLAKTEAGRYELRTSSFDARDALNAALRLVRVQADEAGVDLRAAPAPAPVVVEADERALKQMALNLLANALKFTPHGGHVTAAISAQGGELQLQVADTGVGISAADLVRLGRPFEQAESAQGHGGTGLGLSLVRSFARLHGGEMHIESRLGAGTAVTVRMPVLLSPATTTSAETP